uniref:Uncharacterized protein n=1 Tax=Panagrolaimus davidi TaxID=227884 RepID=A0A914QXY3_9BILA
MGENLITRILIFECLFDFIPHLIDMIFVATTETTPMTFIGPFSRTIVVFDSLSTSITNFRAFYRMYQQNTSKVNTIVTNFQNIKISPTAVNLK